MISSFKADLPPHWWIEGVIVDTGAQLVALWSGQQAVFFALD